MQINKPLNPKDVPVYVREILSRSGFEFDYLTTHPDFVQGYTIYVRKRTPYTQARTFRQEISQLCAWANRTAGARVAKVLHCPDITHYCDQFAHITILDPVMLQIEDYIRN